MARIEELSFCNNFRPTNVLREMNMQHFTPVLQSLVIIIASEDIILKMSEGFVRCSILLLALTLSYNRRYKLNAHLSRRVQASLQS